MEISPSTIPVLNPWLSIWKKPRATIQQIIDSKPRRLVLPLAALGGIVHALNNLYEVQIKSGNSLSTFGLILITGAITGIFSLFFASTFLDWTGRWLGGRALPEHIWAAMAWSEIPFICSIVLWPFKVMLWGRGIAKVPSDNIEGSLLLTLYQGLLAIEAIMIIWGFIIFLHCLGQVQGFSVWKALWNVILATSVSLTVITAIVFIAWAVLA